MDQVTIPADYASLVALLVNPLTMGVLLTWFLSHIPFIKSDSVTNWVKFTFAVVVCLIWSLVVWVAKNGALPSTTAAWYSALYVGLAVVVSNQLFYQAAQHIPAIRDFLLLWNSKPTVTGTSTLMTGVAGASIKTTTEVEQPAQPPTLTLPVVEAGVHG